MKWLVSLLAMLILAAQPVRAGDRIGVPGFGVSLIAPDGWQAVPSEGARDHLAEVRRADGERLRPTGASAPPILLLRRHEHRANVVPGLNVLLRPLFVDRTAIAVAARLQRVAGEGLGEIEILDAAHSVRISGQPAAHLRIAYTVRQGDTVTHLVSEYWVIIRGDHILSFAAGYGRDEGPEVREELLAAIDSVRIDPEG